MDPRNYVLDGVKIGRIHSQPRELWPLVTSRCRFVWSFIFCIVQSVPSLSSRAFLVEPFPGTTAGLFYRIYAISVTADATAFSAGEPDTD